MIEHGWSGWKREGALIRLVVDPARGAEWLHCAFEPCLSSGRQNVEHTVIVCGRPIRFQLPLPERPDGIVCVATEDDPGAAFLGQHPPDVAHKNAEIRNQIQNLVANYEVDRAGLHFVPSDGVQQTCTGGKPIGRSGAQGLARLDSNESRLGKAFGQMG